MDMDFSQFVIMFKSIFMQGFSRPYEGVRKILNSLINKYKENGGELLLNREVIKINSENSKFKSILLDHNQVIFADKLFSSCGLYETYKLNDELKKEINPNYYGNLSFVETIFYLNKSPKSHNFNSTIIFYNENPIVNYKKSDDFIDLSSGVICCSNNFLYDKELEYNILRMTNISNFDLFNSTNYNEYYNEKAFLRNKIVNKLKEYSYNFENEIIYEDMFTPKTINKFTSHINGAVYGATKKIKNGMTNIKNLYIIGTDQGFLGITGAMLSGISMANLHGFKENN
jgi:phytoene dehydrogenase-like protein